MTYFYIFQILYEVHELVYSYVRVYMCCCCRFLYPVLEEQLQYRVLHDVRAARRPVHEDGAVPARAERAQSDGGRERRRGGRVPGPAAGRPQDCLLQSAHAARLALLLDDGVEQ